MNRIVVGIDGSESSQYGLKVATELAAAFKAKLLICHVVPLQGSMDVYGVMTPELFARQEELAEQLLHRSEESAKGVDVESLLLRGPAAQSLADVAERTHADLVVVGSRGRGAVSRVLLGSVADRLTHVCKSSVLIARAAS